MVNFLIIAIIIVLIINIKTLQNSDVRIITEMKVMTDSPWLASANGRLLCKKQEVAADKGAIN